jgi:signal transduction histidine kinase
MVAMIEPRMKKHALAALFTAALVGGLAFLFVRTVGIDFRGDAQALTLLRELKDFDARRDVDAMRVTADFETHANPSDWSALRARALRELEKDPARAAVSAQLPSIRSAVTEKESAYQALRTAHGTTMRAYKSADEALLALSTAATAARMRSAALAATTSSNIERIRAVIRDANIEHAVENSHELEARAAALSASAAGADPFLLTSANRAETGVGEFVTARLAEAAAWRKFAYTTAGGRIELASQAASRSIERALDEKDAWRIYLVTYAAALALVLGYLGIRAVLSLDRLRTDNAELEASCSQRSRDLAGTLRKLQDADAQRVHNSRMSSLGQLLAGAAHEITRPITFVREHLNGTRGALPDLRAALTQAEHLVELLRPANADPREVRDCADLLADRLRRLAAEHALEGLEALAWEGLKGVEQIAELSAKLRDFARYDRGRVAGFNVNDGVQAALLIARPLLRKVDVEKTLADVPGVTCSPTLLNQVLLTLVTNAVDAIDKPHGRISIATRDARGRVAIEVSDNGKGIAPDALERIFDAGGGLNVARGIVERHGGRIEARSREGVGSTFIVTLTADSPQESVSSEVTRSALA